MKKIAGTNIEQSASLSACFHTVKLFTGVCNNAAVMVMLDAHDKIKLHPHYRHAVKAAYKQALTAWKDYERRLLYEKDSYFDTKALPDSERKRYGDISDMEYFELWKGLGAKAYIDTRPLVTSLWNKHRLSLINHKIEYPDLLAWPMTAQASLDIAEYIYNWCIDSCNINGIPIRLAKKAFNVFSLENVAKAWRRALIMTEPATSHIDLEDVENRNIEAGIIQLLEKWSDPRGYYDSAVSATKDFEDVYRTKTEAKKAAIEWLNLKGEFLKELGC